MQENATPLRLGHTLTNEQKTVKDLVDANVIYALADKSGSTTLCVTGEGILPLREMGITLHDRGRMVVDKTSLAEKLGGEDVLTRLTADMHIRQQPSIAVRIHNAADAARIPAWRR